MTRTDVDAFAGRFAGFVVDGPGQVCLAPTTTEETREIVRAAQADHVGITVVGAASTMQGRVDGVALTTRALAGVVDHQPDDLTVVVRSGTTVSELDGILDRCGQSAMLPERDPARTIGGIVASGASGFRRLRYGPTRDRVLGVTVVTGYGEIVRGGGQLVKNVTGYDLARLMVGSHGELGVITEVSLKLWPEPPASRTVLVPDPVVALDAVYRPSAVVETAASSSCYLEGSRPAVEEACRILGSDGFPGFRWPSTIEAGSVVSVRVPPRSVTATIAVLRGHAAGSFVAQHGVGVIDAGFDSLAEGRLDELRASIGELGGVVVVDRETAEELGCDRWGTEPGGLDVQRRLKDLFDPARVINRGLLPGGL